MKTSYFNINTLLTRCVAFLCNHGWIEAENVFANYGFNTTPCNSATIKYNIQ